MSDYRRDSDKDWMGLRDRRQFLEYFIGGGVGTIVLGFLLPAISQS